MFCVNASAVTEEMRLIKVCKEIIDNVINREGALLFTSWLWTSSAD